MLDINITRRRFIQGASVLAGGSFTTNVFSTEKPITSFDQVIKELSLKKDVLKLGRIYLKQHNLSYSKETHETLYKQLQNKLKTNDIDTELKQKIDAQIALDFELDEVAVVSGWWLSDTESKLCAIACLS